MREAALSYFTDKKIAWHQGRDHMPSNHLCDSQVCCVNFLGPFSSRPDALAELLRPVFPTIKRILPMEKPEVHVSFEWIGQENYLEEKVPKHGRRTRGANCTSADAAVKFEREDGQTQIALIEWKYTESYGGESLRIAKSGTDRTQIYAHLYERSDCPIDKSRFQEFGDLFFEPFYQFMRQQFLASEMERAKELDASVVSVLHLAPAHNSDFQRVTAPRLRHIGTVATAVWRQLVREPDRFRSASIEDLFSRLPVSRFPDLTEWWRYIRERYSWINGTA